MFQKKKRNVNFTTCLYNRNLINLDERDPPAQFYATRIRSNESRRSFRFKNFINFFNQPECKKSFRKILLFLLFRGEKWPDDDGRGCGRRNASVFRVTRETKTIQLVRWGSVVNYFGWSLILSRYAIPRRERGG